MTTPFDLGLVAHGIAYSIGSLSYGGTSLAVVRASDLKMMAVQPSPPPGTPGFSRSGRWLTLTLQDGTTTALFELVP